MATTTPTFSVCARISDVEALSTHVEHGDLPATALLPAAALLNAKRKVDAARSGHCLSKIFAWMPSDALTMPVVVPANDREHFERMAAICGMSEVGVEAAAGAVGSLRVLQGDLGPGHTALDVVASVLPRRFVDNWAAKWLGKAA